MLRRRALTSIVAVSRPSMEMAPDVGSISRLIIVREVVLPHPEGPAKTTISPERTSTDSSPTAVTRPYRLLPRAQVTPPRHLELRLGRGRPGRPPRRRRRPARWPQRG